ncbi:TolC family protein [Pelistega europaea]|uniref:TolC family protein n=1 Tax=Pelistega europaea TaxID=106147 RepID=A0A7Y4LC54_9BURK|nr:TolC family protein [Pelistega europaea]NOL49732.1 TolC family protein [Pelistega europaea]
MQKTLKYLPHSVVMMVLATAMPNTGFAKTPLQEVLQYALKQDPRLLEAKAEQDAATQNRKASEALHYPTVAVTSSHMLGQHHRYESDYDRETDAGLRGKLNLYSWGGIEASIDRDKKKERSAYYKFFETRETLGSEIANLYVAAIYYKESLEVAKRNLERHKKFMDNLRVVSTYDTGRLSEFSQAESRYLQAQSSIVDLERSLQTTLSRLNLYFNKRLTVNDLIDPFKDKKAEDFFKTFNEGPKDNVHPSMLAQQAELDSAIADIDVTDATTKPQINLEGLATRYDRNAQVTLSWDLFNRPAHYNTENAKAKVYSAQARLQQIKRDITERYETAKINMLQSQNQANISQRHVTVQTKVANDYAEQFTVSRRTLLEVLDAYADLSRTETTYVNARHEFRTSTLEFLLAQAKIARWAGLPENL